MSRSETPLLLILGVLFLAMAGWLGLSAWESFQDPIRSTLAVPVTVEETVALEGILLREEQTLETHLPCCTLFARSGERCAAGAVLGAAGTDAAAVNAARRLAESRQLLTRRDTQEAAALYAAAVSRGDMAAAGAAVLVLADSPESTALLEADAALLEYRLSGRVELLLSPASGLFFPWVDGYEHLSPTRLTALTPAGLDDLLRESPAFSGGVCGRIVTGQDWYFAARTTETEARQLCPGDSLSLTLAGGYPAVWAEVCSVSPPEDGLCAVVLRCYTGLRESAGARFVSATAVTRRYQGLQLPREALRRDEAGDYVYLSTGLTAERVDVEILHENNGFLLVTGEGLHPGSEILIGGSQLYDGRLLT